MHATETQLNDYVDDALDGEEARRIEQHLADCATCTAEVAQLRALKTRLAGLPREIEPERDLRPLIARRNALWGVRYRLAAAAVLLIAVSSLLTLALVERTRTMGFASGDREDVRLVSRDVDALEREYSDEVRELEMILRKNRAALAPSTLRIVEENLAIIDSAIRESQTALAADPNSEMLVDLLRSAYERKLELLRRAARSSPAT